VKYIREIKISMKNLTKKPSHGLGLGYAVGNSYRGQ
jgi:hypothetical protein